MDLFLFFRFGAVQPIYINLIRDPLDRLVSAYHFSRFGDYTLENNTLWFKGKEQKKNLVCVTLAGQDSTLNYVTNFFFL